MTSLSPMPAAQYLRMSTEMQGYSLANQAGAIEQYVTCPPSLVQG